MLKKVISKVSIVVSIIHPLKIFHEIALLWVVIFHSSVYPVNRANILAEIDMEI